MAGWWLDTNFLVLFLHLPNTKVRELLVSFAVFFIPDCMEKAGFGSGMAGSSQLVYLDQQGILVAISCDFFDDLIVAAGGSLMPKLLT